MGGVNLEKSRITVGHICFGFSVKFHLLKKERIDKDSCVPDTFTFILFFKVLDNYNLVLMIFFILIHAEVVSLQTLKAPKKKC
jgi:hypothetical protein